LVLKDIQLKFNQDSGWKIHTEHRKYPDSTFPNVHSLEQ
jgi:hypothetical protein